MYNTIKLEKGLYNLTGKIFHRCLKKQTIRKLQGYASCKSDAFERQLKRLISRLMVQMQILLRSFHDN